MSIEILLQTVAVGFSCQSLSCVTKKSKLSD